MASAIGRLLAQKIKTTQQFNQISEEDSDKIKRQVSFLRPSTRDPNEVHLYDYNEEKLFQQMIWELSQPARSLSKNASLRHFQAQMPQYFEID